MKCLWSYSVSPAPMAFVSSGLNKITTSYKRIAHLVLKFTFNWLPCPLNLSKFSPDISANNGHQARLFSQKAPDDYHHENYRIKDGWSPRKFENFDLNSGQTKASTARMEINNGQDEPRIGDVTLVPIVAVLLIAIWSEPC